MEVKFCLASSLVVAGIGGSRKGRDGDRWGGGEEEGGTDRESRIPG